MARQFKTQGFCPANKQGLDKQPVKGYGSKDDLDICVAGEGYGDKDSRDNQPISRRNSSGGYTTGES